MALSKRAAINALACKSKESKILHNGIQKLCKIYNHILTHKSSSFLPSLSQTKGAS